MEVIFRNKTEAPTKPGYYYARWAGVNFIDETTIFPCTVFRAKDRLLVEIGPEDCPVEIFDWFGPVPTVREG